MTPKELIAKANQIHARIYEIISEMKPQGVKPNMYDSADQAFALKRLEETLDDLRKEAKKLKSKHEQIANACWLVVYANRKKKEPIRTELVTASPKQTECCKLPKQRTDEYVLLMNFLGVAKELIDADIFRIHWPNFMEWITKKYGEGVPPLPGIDTNSEFWEYSLTYREKKKNGD